MPKAVSRLLVYSGALVLAMTAAAGAAEASEASDRAAQAAAEALERLYGQDLERVRGTPDPADDVALAGRLLAASGST